MTNIFSLPPNQPGKHRRARRWPAAVHGGRPMALGALAALAFAVAPVAPQVASADPTCTTTSNRTTCTARRRRHSA
jgi:hypothetical protein